MFYSGSIIPCEAEFPREGMFAEVVYKSGIYLTRMDK